MPVVVTRTEYYEIRGRTLAELSQALNNSGLVDPAGDPKRQFAGKVFPEILWEWGSAPGPFDPRSIEVTATIIVKLPRWTPLPGTDARVVRTWSLFIDALAAHEEKHVAILRRCTDELPVFVQSQSPRDYREGNIEGHRMLIRCGQENTDLDVRTNHGATEGLSRDGWT